MTTAAQTVTRNAPETDSQKAQVTVSRAIHVLSTEDEPRQVVSHRDRTCRNLENLKLPEFLEIRVSPAPLGVIRNAFLLRSNQRR
jgi:hypothetical protein